MVRAAAFWLLDHLTPEPRLMTEVAAAAQMEGLSRKIVQKAARTLPVLRRPRELRGPWVWSFPRDDEQVLVSYRCPLAECPVRREGWMPFGLSRPLFACGLVRYLIRGRLRRTRSGAETDYLRPLKEDPSGEE